MYAVISTGGKQYKVKVGQHLDVERLNINVGEEVVFDHVHFLNDGKKIKVGQPLVKKAKVNAKVIKHFRGEKILILKHKRRKHHMKRQGHRQNLTEVLIESINK